MYVVLQKFSCYVRANHQAVANEKRARIAIVWVITLEFLARLSRWGRRGNGAESDHVKMDISVKVSLFLFSFLCPKMSNSEFIYRYI